MAKVTKADLSEITQDPLNLNKHAERGSALTRKSIERFGARLAGVLDRENRIIDGNDRQIAFGEADLNEIEIIEADARKPVYLRFNDLDLADPDNPARELQVALHRSAIESFSVDAENLLAAMAEGLDTSDWFRQDELDELLAGLVAPEPVEDSPPDVSKADELQKKWSTSLGQIWQLGKHKIACGSSTDAEVINRLMQDEKIDCITTDPPYGVDYDGGTKVREKLSGDDTPNLYLPALTCWKGFCNSHVALYLWYADGDQAVAQAVAQAGWHVRRNLIWNKNQAQFGALSQQYHQKHEPFLYCHLKGKSPYWGGDATEVTVWDIDRHSVNEFHPTQKPPELFARAIKNSSKEGDIVFDGFLGSGTTVISCEQTGRIARGVELSASYIAVILQRFQDATNITPILLS